MSTNVELIHPDVQFASDVWQRIQAFTEIAKGEWSCMGLVKQIRETENGPVTALMIDEIIFIEQINTAAYTELDDEGLAKALIEVGQRDNGDEERMRAWIHSHGTNSVFWSPQDETCISDLIGSMNQWLISVVVNKKNEYRCRIDLPNPMRVTIDKIQIKVIGDVNPFHKECAEIYKAKAKESKGSIVTGAFSRQGASADSYVGQEGYDYASEFEDSWANYETHDRPSTTRQLPARTMTSPTEGQGKNVGGVGASSTGSQTSTDALEQVDIYRPGELISAFPHVQELDFAVMWMAWETELIDDTTYASNIDDLIHSKRIEDLLDEKVVAKLEREFITKLGSKEDVSTIIETSAGRRKPKSKTEEVAPTEANPEAEASTAAKDDDVTDVVIVEDPTESKPAETKAEKDKEPGPSPSKKKDSANAATTDKVKKAKKKGAAKEKTGGSGANAAA